MCSRQFVRSRYHAIPEGSWRYQTIRYHRKGGPLDTDTIPIPFARERSVSPPLTERAMDHHLIISQLAITQWPGVHDQVKLGGTMHRLDWYRSRHSGLQKWPGFESLGGLEAAAFHERVSQIRSELQRLLELARFHGALRCFCSRLGRPGFVDLCSRQGGEGSRLLRTRARRRLRGHDRRGSRLAGTIY